MIYDPQSFINTNEPIYSTGNCYFSADSQKTVRYVLTSRKLIQAGENHLVIIPVNKITGISDNGFIIVVHAENNSMVFYHAGHPEWYAPLIQTLAKFLALCYTKISLW